MSRDLGGLWTLSGQEAVIAAAKSALNSLAKDVFSGSYYDNQEAPDDMQADDEIRGDDDEIRGDDDQIRGDDDQIRGDGDEIRGDARSIVAGEDSVSLSSSEDDNEDNETFEPVAPRVKNPSNEDAHEDLPAATTPEQAMKTARKLSCMQRELATTKTFVQQMDYTA